MQGVRQTNDFVAAIGRTLGGERFKLVILGAQSGALEQGWGSFGASLTPLTVVATDAEAAEIETEGAVVVADLSAPAPIWADPPFGRFSDARARALRAETVEPLDIWLARQLAPRRDAMAAGHDDYCAGFEPIASPLTAAIDEAGFGDADFLRMDAGWADYYLLTQLGLFLQRDSLQGVSLKVHLHGAHGAKENTFHNVDRLLRQKGFELFQLEPVRYSSAALPWPFMDKHPDHASGGRTLFAKAVYLRDLAREPTSDEAPPGERIAKAAALRALYGMPDQAAELLVVLRTRLEGLIDVSASLDQLARHVQVELGADMPYRDYIAAFEAGSPRLYDMYGQQAAWAGRLLSAYRGMPGRIADLEAKIRELALELERHETAAAAKPKGIGWLTKAKSAPFDLQIVRENITRRSIAHPEHHWIFDHFGPWRGPVNDRQVQIDFIGSRTGAEVGEFSPSPVDPNFCAPLPVFDEEYFEWVDLLEAVHDAGPKFTMLELGAGYGRWSGRAAMAARAMGKSLRLGVAEAEPKHANWLRRHLANNGVDSSAYELFEQAVAGKFGKVVFAVAAPEGVGEINWFGQAIVPVDVMNRPVIGDYFGLPMYEDDHGWKLIVVPQIPLSTVLKSYDFIDLADLDIQGCEADAIAEAIEPLTEKVRRLHIGTHGHDIEARLRQILAGRGWVCLRDFPCHGVHDTPYGPVNFVDGVQSWINPALYGARGR